MKENSSRSRLASMKVRYFFAALAVFIGIFLICFIVSEFLFTMFEAKPYTRLAAMLIEWIAAIALTGWLVNVKLVSHWYRSDFSVLSMPKREETEEEADARRLRQAKENHRQRVLERRRAEALARQAKKEEEAERKEKIRKQKEQKKLEKRKQLEEEQQKKEKPKEKQAELTGKKTMEEIPPGSFLHSADETKPMTFDEVNSFFTPKNEPVEGVKKQAEPSEEKKPLKPIPIPREEAAKPVRKKHHRHPHAEKTTKEPEEKPGSIVHQADRTMDLSREQLEDLFNRVSGNESGVEKKD